MYDYWQSGTCTLQEAVIIGSIIQKVSIPPLHSMYSAIKESSCWSGLQLGDFLG